MSSVGTLAMSIWLMASFETGDAGFQFVSKHTWIEPWGISWHLGVDGISLFLVVLTGVLFPLAIVGIDPHHDEKPYLAWLLLLQAGVMGSFLSLDLFVFFIFFEIVLVPMYFLIAGWGYEKRVYAATKFFLFTMLGSAFMLVGLIATVAIASEDLGYTTFDLVEIAEGADFAASTGRWLFFAFAIAFAVKVPLVPRAHLAARRPHPGADRRLGRARRRDAQARHLRPAALRALPVPRGVVLEPPALAHAGGDRHHLRRDRRHDADRPEAARRLLVGRPHGLHRARHVRVHDPVAVGRRDPDDQPRRVDRCAVPARRHDLRAPPHPLDRRAQRHPEGRADLRRRVHGRDAVVDRRARPERVRRRVPDPHRVVPHRSLVDGRRRVRCDPRCAVPAVGLPACVPRRARRGEQERSPN